MNIINIQKCGITSRQPLPFFLSPVRAGFPSPAEDYLDKTLDLNEHLIKHPAATFFVKVRGDSMVNAGIHCGDTLIVDKSLEPKDHCVAVVILDGEFTVKKIRKRGKRLYLISENENFQPIEITEDNDFEIWGIVIHVIHSF